MAMEGLMQNSQVSESEKLDKTSTQYKIQKVIFKDTQPKYISVLSRPSSLYTKPVTDFLVYPYQDADLMIF